MGAVPPPPKPNMTPKEKAEYRGVLTSMMVRNRRQASFGITMAAVAAAVLIIGILLA